MTTFTINGRAFSLPVLKFLISAEILDSEGTGRMQSYGWPMFRDPQGVIKNIEMELGLTNSSNDPDFIALLRELDDFGQTDFKTITFITPAGPLTQEMYGASYQVEAKRFERNGVTFWGTLPVKFIAKRAVS